MCVVCVCVFSSVKAPLTPTALEADRGKREVLEADVVKVGPAQANLTPLKSSHACAALVVGRVAGTVPLLQVPL